jgi:hypothetical protein
MSPVHTITYYFNICLILSFHLSADIPGKRRESAVGTATRYGLDGRGIGVWVQVGSKILSSPRRPDRLWGPPSLLSNWYRGLLPRGVKRPRRKADHSPPISVEVIHGWVFASTPQYHLCEVLRLKCYRNFSPVSCMLCIPPIYPLSLLIFFLWWNLSTFQLFNTSSYLCC